MESPGFEWAKTHESTTLKTQGGSDTLKIQGGSDEAQRIFDILGKCRFYK